MPVAVDEAPTSQLPTSAVDKEKSYPGVTADYNGGCMEATLLPELAAQQQQHQLSNGAATAHFTTTSEQLREAIGREVEAQLAAAAAKSAAYSRMPYFDGIRECYSPSPAPNANGNQQRKFTLGGGGDNSNYSRSVSPACNSVVDRDVPPPCTTPSRRPTLLEVPPMGHKLKRRHSESGVCLSRMGSGGGSTDDEAEADLALNDLLAGGLKHRELESRYKPELAVNIRRRYMERITGRSLYYLPHEHYDYSMVSGACCENVIGYIPIPTGIAGPLKINGECLHIPMATTEGALIASTNRGCRVLNSCGDGVTAICINDGMTRAPVLRFDRALQACECKSWLEREENIAAVKDAFDSTSRFARLSRVSAYLSGNLLYLRFTAITGDAMGMNMVTKGTTEAINLIRTHFPDSHLESISGNMCVDKKASALNWIEGRGKSVVADAVVPTHVLKGVLKTTASQLVRLARAKLHIGSTNAVCIGGGNAHAANIVAAIFLATGQDAAQVVSSSMCSTQVEEVEDGALHISCTMNCMEVGTVGGGTILAPQKTCLRMLGCAGPGREGTSGENSKRLAKIICSAVLAGELSLLASQCIGDLMSSHLRLNRSKQDLFSCTSSRSSFAEPTTTSPAQGGYLQPHYRGKLEQEMTTLSLISKGTLHTPDISLTVTRSATPPAEELP